MRLHKAHGGRGRRSPRRGSAELLRRRSRGASTDTGSPSTFLRPSGSRSSTPGNCRAGRPTGTWPAWAGRHGWPEAQREVLWSIFERVRAGTAEGADRRMPQMFTRPGGDLRRTRPHPPFDFAVVDEAQDLSVSRSSGSSPPWAARPNAPLLRRRPRAADLPAPFSWKSLGVDVRGRSRTLRVNYRTSHQIRTQADRLLDPRSPTSTATRRTERHGLGVQWPAAA